MSSKKGMFFKKITDFCDRYPENYYILSSRPYSEFVEFQRFTVLTVHNFSKKQAVSLVNKLDFDKNIKKRFVKALKESLYDRHKSFASNPLLLNIMLLTYDNYAEIPEKLHLFYANAFETLYSKHDATKGGYRREIKSKLSFDSFKRVFSNFCFITYFQGKMEFTYEELVNFLKKSKIKSIEFDVEAVIDDLVNSICMLCKDGLDYRFTHRSFQEYFTSIFLKELSDESLKKMGVGLIKKDVYRATHDNVFNMLYDMSEERVEQSILLPIIETVEADCSTDKYDFYFERVEPTILFDFYGSDEKPQLIIKSDTGRSYIRFLRQVSYKYRKKTDTEEEYEAKLLAYIEENMGYEMGQHFEMMKYKDNGELYEIFRHTWVGNMITVLADMKDMLTAKAKENEINLSELLAE